MKKRHIIVGFLLVVILAMSACGKEEQKIYKVEMEIKDMGVIKLELDAEEAPITTKNFVKLAKEGFYDGLTIHRVVENFMIQGGDPNGNGTGSSSKKIKGEFKNNGVENNISHTRGTISMGRDPKVNDSASCQFFIVHKDSVYLDGNYAAFGHVTEGMEIVDEIAENTPVANPETGFVAKENQPIIVSVKVVE